MQITFDSKEIKKALAKLSGETSTNLWYRVASLLFSKIIRNIQNGIDINGNQFKDYTMSYKKIRTKEGLGVDVNLQNSSNMIRSLTINADKDGFTIYFTGRDNQQKAEWVTEGGRKFLGWGSETINEFDKVLQDYINKIFNGEL